MIRHIAAALKLGALVVILAFGGVLATYNYIDEMYRNIDSLTPKAMIDAKIDYGVKCDGIADDTVALQAAITAASTVGTAAVLPAGTCLFAPPLKITNTMILLGGGYGDLNLGFSRPRTILRAISGKSAGPLIAISDVAQYTVIENLELKDVPLNVNAIRSSGGVK